MTIDAAKIQLGALTFISILHFNKRIRAKFYNLNANAKLNHKVLKNKYLTVLFLKDFSQNENRKFILGRTQLNLKNTIRNRKTTWLFPLTSRYKQDILDCEFIRTNKGDIVFLRFVHIPFDLFAIYSVDYFLFTTSS